VILCIFVMFFVIRDFGFSTTSTLSDPYSLVEVGVDFGFSVHSFEVNNILDISLSFGIVFENFVE